MYQPQRGKTTEECIYVPTDRDVQEAVQQIQNGWGEKTRLSRMVPGYRPLPASTHTMFERSARRHDPHKQE